MAPHRIAVIGSNSFSGSDFIDLLLQDPNKEVIGLSRSREKNGLFLRYKRRRSSRFRFFQLDLNAHGRSVTRLLDSFRPEGVVNFAAQSEVAPSWEHPEQWFETNVVALARLCNHLKNAGYLKRFVQISSPEVYGSCRGVSESAPMNPSTPYAASKAAADFFLSALFRHCRFPLITIRSTNVYGAGQQLFKIIPRSVIYVKLRRRIELHGGGRAVKSYIHIRDVSRGTLAAMERGRVGEIYHLSPDAGVAVRDVVRKICRLMGVPFRDAASAVTERLGQDAKYEICSAKARKKLGWKPVISLEEGLRGVIAWIEENWTEIQKEPLHYVYKA